MLLLDKGFPGKNFRFEALFVCYFSSSIYRLYYRIMLSDNSDSKDEYQPYKYLVFIALN